MDKLVNTEVKDEDAEGWELDPENKGIPDANESFPNPNDPTDILINDFKNTIVQVN